MLESEGGPQGTASTSYEEGSEEGLSVLPRNTKVIVTGNNRTKSFLVGLHGVVKKAVGLGGWHWLLLTNGVEVKLQRNALSVIEGPTGHEDDGDDDTPFSSGSIIDEFPRTFKSLIRPRRSSGSMSDDGNGVQAPAQLSGNSSDIKDDETIMHNPASSSGPTPIVDLSKLETAALKRYRRHFKLVEVGPNSSKEQLVHAVGRHFMSQQLDELQVISGFMQATKRLKA